MKCFHKNWITSYYGNQGNQVKNNDTFTVEYTCARNTRVNLYNEAIRSVYHIRDDFPNEKYGLLFSGGIESEIMLRSFQESNIPFQVFIGRYERDINLYDVSFAVTICESRNIPYTIIDFDLAKFLQNDALEIARTATCSEARLLPQLALADKLDIMPIMANGEAAPRRLDRDYEKPSTWVLDEDENFWSWPRYFTIQNRPAVPEYCRYTSEMYNTWFNLRWFKLLTTDKIYGKTAAWSSKIDGYREQYADLITRRKLTGFETVEHLFNDLNHYLEALLPDQITHTYTVDGFFEHKLHAITETSTKLYRKQ